LHVCCSVFVSTSRTVSRVTSTYQPTNTLSEVCIVLGSIVAAKGNKWLKKWLEAIQRRVNFTTRIVNQYRSVKMAGLSKLLSMKLLRFRDEEIEISKAYRLYGVVIFALCEFSYW
jgi:hypothetical protein